MYVQLFKTIPAKLYEEFQTQNYLKLVHDLKKKNSVEGETILIPRGAEAYKLHVAQFLNMTIFVQILKTIASKL